MYDVIIIGAGSAGLTAGVYLSRYGIKNLIIGELLGGTLTSAHKVENFPGFEDTPGAVIMDKLLSQTKSCGSEILQDTIELIQKNGDNFLIKTMGGKEINSKLILIAIGNKYKKLNISGEEKFIGRGVSYCATCDGMFFKNKEVVIIGGGDAALSEAIYLSSICSKIHLIHRGDLFKAAKSWIDQVESKSNIEIHKNSNIKEIKGSLYVEEVVLNNGDILKVDGVFIEIGNEPDTKIFNEFNLQKDNEGYIVVDKTQKTSVSGIYAAGDITTNSNKFKQSVVAAAEGAIAANSMYEYLTNS
ncbi:FAD-dependent oxidoreductase [Candidatus Gracilibacteria bacterium]|nr:FAD-dependent oxidoreductase [Candidatus Gracilibacteria bacterium]